MKKTYHHAGIGGTFDHFHSGHISLIRETFSRAEKVSIGITTDSLLKNKKIGTSVESFNERQKSLVHFLKKNGLLSRSYIFPLENIFGVAISDPTIDLLVVTKETYQNAKKINTERKKLGFAPCKIYIIPYIKGKDNKIIRSQRIRQGDINTEGTPYISFFNKYLLKLPSTLREELRKPLGTIINGTDDQSIETATKATTYIQTLSPLLIITVGDVVTKTLMQVGLHPDIAIIDYKTQRHHKITHIHTHNQSKTLLNAPGTINKKVVLHLKKTINLKLQTNRKITTTISIRGEEDLTALVAIVLAPLQSTVIYGQMNTGIIVVSVNEKIKSQIAKLLPLFE